MKCGVTLIELLITVTVFGLLLSLATEKVGPTAKRDAYLLQRLIETGIIEARLNSSEVSIQIANHTALRRGARTTSRLSLSSVATCDHCDISISARGAVSPTTIALEGAGRCLVVVSLRGRVRSLCNA
jgi:prepilin-type N-terminal cleavage/methylation domain-containing protein